MEKPPLRLTGKIDRQLQRRGWTPELVLETYELSRVQRPSKRRSGGPATAYFRADLSYIVVEDGTGVVVQISNRSWLKHAYYPNWNLRFFQHRLGRYEQLTAVDTASGDNEVHEHVIVRGQTGRLCCEMDHHAFPSVEVFVEKHPAFCIARNLRECSRQPRFKRTENRACGSLFSELNQIVRQPRRPTLVTQTIYLLTDAGFALLQQRRF